MVLDRIEALLNRQVGGSPRARDLLGQLAGRSLVVDVRPGLLEIEIRSDGSALRLSRNPQTAPDARMAGTPLALLGLAGASPENSVRSGAVDISGDAEIADRFRELLKLVRPEMVEELARLVGPAPASALSGLLGGAGAWLRTAGDTALRNVGEYVTHERGDVVSRAEGRAFLEGVDRLREDVDRLAARIAQLE
ncbi:hypothetical protein EON77_18815 [bacterium]|nr:MAG: hypothetical protein EON77_18815 [bacterium]